MSFELNREQRALLKYAELGGRAYCTLVDGRVVIILPLCAGEEERSAQLVTAIRALDQAFPGDSN